MKKILTIIMILSSVYSYAQDTLTDRCGEATTASGIVFLNNDSLLVHVEHYKDKDVVVVAKGTAYDALCITLDHYRELRQKLTVAEILLGRVNLDLFSKMVDEEYYYEYVKKWEELNK